MTVWYGVRWYEDKLTGKNLKKMEGSRRGSCLDIRSDAVRNFDSRKAHYIEV